MKGQKWLISCIKKYRKNIAISSGIAIFSDVSKQCNILLLQYIAIKNAHPWLWWFPFVTRSMKQLCIMFDSENMVLGRSISWDVCQASVLEQFRLHVIRHLKGWDADARREHSKSLQIHTCSVSVSAAKCDSRVELQLADVAELLLLVRTHLWIKERSQRMLCCLKTALSVLWIVVTDPFCPWGQDLVRTSEGPWWGAGSTQPPEWNDDQQMMMMLMMMWIPKKPLELQVAFSQASCPTSHT